MAQQNINIGTPNGQNGDFVRDAFSKAEDNFTELYNISTNSVDAGAEWRGGLDFYVFANSFKVENVWYSAVAQTLSLAAANATFDRIDLAVANINGTVQIITGEITGATPAEPNYDHETQFPIKFIFVSAGATDPTGYGNVQIFDEDLGDPTEWNFTADAPEVTINPAISYSGTKSVEGLNTLHETAYFSSPSAVNSAEMNTLSFWVKLKENYQVKGKIFVYFGSGAAETQRVPISVAEIRHNQYGFDALDTGWQQIILPIADVDIYIPAVSVIEIKPYKDIGGTTGWYIDDVILQTSTTGGIPTEPTIPSKTSGIENDGADGTSTYVEASVLGAVATSNDYNDLLNLPALVTVATSGDYNDLSNLPSLATVATSGDYNDLSNLPSLATVATSGDYNDLSNLPTLSDEISTTTFRLVDGATPTKKMSFDVSNVPAVTTWGMSFIGEGTIITEEWLTANPSSPVSSVKEVKVTLTPAQLLNLQTTPVVVVPAGGANTVIKILAITGYLNFNTVAYDFTTQLDFKYETSGIEINVGVIADWNAGAIQAFDIDKTGPSGGELSINEGIALSTVTNATVGNSDIKLTILYAIQDFS